MRKTVALLTSLLLLVAACSSSGGDGNGDAQSVKIDPTPSGLAAAAEATTASTAKMAFTMTMSGSAFAGIPGAPSSIEMTGTGVIDFENARQRIEMDLSSILEALSDAGGSPVEQQLLAQFFGEPLVLIQDGAVSYMKFAAFTALLGQGAEWIRTDPADFVDDEDLAALSANQTGGFNAADPTAFLAFLNGATDVTEVGSSEVNGVSTTQYEATLTQRQALEAAPGDQKEALENYLESLEATTPGAGAGTSAMLDNEFTVNVFVDDAGLVRRYTMNFDDFYGGEGPGTVSGLITLDFSDFGTPVTIDIPADDEVVDFADAFGGLGLTPGA